jgi:hypothetical protein
MGIRLEPIQYLRNTRLTDIGDALEQLRSAFSHHNCKRMPAKPRPGSCEKPQTTNNLLILVMLEPAI